MKLLRLTAIALMVLATLSAAADKTHVAKKGESIGGIAYMYDIAVDELLRHNPQAANGVRPGMKIAIPDQKGAAYSATSEGAPAEEAIANVTDVIDVADVTDVAVADSVADDAEFDPAEWPELEVDSSARTNILVLLPLTGHHDRQAENYIDFYRGMVLAARNAKDAAGLQVGIHTYDMPADTLAMVDLAHRAIADDVAAIVVPNSEYQIELISGIAAEHGAYVANFFSVKDSTYVTNPCVLQTYINQRLMYTAAIDYILTHYAGYTPVILNSAKGKKEKEPFVRELRERFERFGLPTLTVNYEETLTLRQLNSLPEGKYVFVVLSGSRDTFNNCAEALSEYMMAHPMDTAVFGYPDWTSFNGEAAEMLHTLGAEIYTRFYLDPRDSRLQQLSAAYEHWYGQEMLQVMPSMAALGYDAGSFLIKWIQDSRGHIEDLLDGEQTYEGLQSTFRMGHGAGAAGYVNTALYFVKYLPDGSVRITIND